MNEKKHGLRKKRVFNGLTSGEKSKARYPQGTELSLGGGKGGNIAQGIALP